MSSLNNNNGNTSPTIASNKVSTSQSSNNGPLNLPSPTLVSQQQQQQASSYNSTSSNQFINASSPNVFSPPSTSPTQDGQNNQSKMLKTRSQSEEFKASVLPTSDSKKKLFISPKILAPKKNSVDDEPPISKTLEGRMKSNPYIKKFKLPSNEILLNDYSAALFRQILLHGKLYIFTNYICFESKIFGIKTTEIIQIKDITQIKKKSRKFKYIGIEVETNSAKHIFASFVSRDKTYQDLLAVWKDITGESHDDASSQSIDDDNDDESNSSVVFEDDSSQKGGNSTNATLPNGASRKPSIESNFTSITTQSLPLQSNSTVDQVVNQQTLQASQPIQPLQQQPSQAQIQISPQTNTNNNNNNQTSVSDDTNNKVSQQPQQQQQDNKISNNNNNNIPVIAEEAVSGQNQKPIDPLDEIYGTVEQYLSKKDESSILESQWSEFQELLSENFNVSVVNFFRALCSDQCNFAFNYHAKRGDSDIVVKNWAHRDRFGTIRELEYVAPVNSPIGPPKTRIQETQRYHLLRSKLIIETDTIMLDIPYGDHFRIEAKWECTETSPETCKLNIHLCVRFIKKTWFKSKIETSTIKESKNSFTQWVTLAKQEIQKLLQIKPKHSSAVTLMPPITNKTIDGISRIKDEDSPKPHHTRSRSRQHLISSSGQVHVGGGSSQASPLTVNTSTSTTTTTTQITTTTPTSLPQGLIPPFGNSSSNNTPTTPGQLIPSPISQSLGVVSDQSDHIKSKDNIGINNNSSSSNVSNSVGKSSSFNLRTPLGSMSFSYSMDQLPLLIISLFLCLVFLYMYLKILSLSSKVETMENIFKDLVNNNHHHHISHKK
ncbi:GRAM domain-containing protein [Tieghemostelium lacteum]|uniref:GRAM domain-containing protein n=1 Tax=Tieghemostelium lacteum TaxID=361077 RepID=A0A151Z699_TIELA|nr:GRAM domain-containing protein [Tieghemostelium lacteum]|eukprot:KYQ89324.1 GRAM domain-containing protein [Tieghemostelium lacteum]